MGRSLLVMGALMGSDVRLAGPEELHPPKDVVDLAAEHRRPHRVRGSPITDDPADAVSGVDFVHTDVWVSMGEPKDVWTERVRTADARTRSTPPCSTRRATRRSSSCTACPPSTTRNTVVGREIMEHTGMTSGLEVTDEVFASPASIVFDQAENRLHTIKAVLVATLG